MTFALPNATHIPLGQLRGRLGELDKSRTIITFCTIGVRSYSLALRRADAEKVEVVMAS